MSTPGVSLIGANTSIMSAEVLRKLRSKGSTCTRARSTASRVATGTIRKGSPHDVTRGACVCSGNRSESCRPSISQISAGSSGGSSIGICATESCAHSGTPSRRRTVTGTGPTFSPSTICTSSPPVVTSPEKTSAIAVPTVGCPANGTSPPGVKMRTRRVITASSAGRTNVVSEKLNSRVTCSISSLVRPLASRITAS